jgi:hypothetical protein
MATDLLFPMTRRHMLKTASCGFGYLALRALMADYLRAADAPLTPKTTHVKPRARRVIFLFMHGGPSHVDTFDPKPKLAEMDGKPIPIKPAAGVSKETRLALMKSPWQFRKYGESGIEVSDLFPQVARHVDDLCIIRSMHTDGQSHGQAVLKLHTGQDTLIRPSMGSWIVYGLGTENQNLPGFVTICPTRGHGGAQNYSNAFLPAAYQGTAIGSAEIPASKAQIRHIRNPLMSSDEQRRQLNLLQAMNQEHLKRTGADPQLEGVIESYELAFRMQTAAPDLMNLAQETKATRDLYGIGVEPTDNFGRQCLLARRFAEAGVRFVQVSHSFKWDQHANLQKDHEKNALEVDKPVGGLLHDLRERGLLDDTLVLWGGEFGRTPMVQGKNGRDHNPQGFTMWLAGGGIKSGFVHGATDEFGYYARENRVHMHDLHATILYLLGLEHEKLTYRHAGRDFRLTDVHGRVVKDIFRKPDERL